MSARASIFGGPDDPREIELVRSLEEKTRERKIRWSREGSAITAKVSGLELTFVMSTGLFSTPGDWQLFTVRDSKSNELVRVEKRVGLLATFGAGITMAADSLYSQALAQIRDDLDAAIDSVKKL